MLIVTGATGQLGRSVVEELLRRVPPYQLAVSVRDPSKAADLAARGVRVRAGDFADPASLTYAFEGAKRILIISSNAAASGGDTLAQHRAAFAAAEAAGALRIFYTSHAAASASSLFPPARDHAATEAMLAAGKVSWTALRHGFYAESAPIFMGDWLGTNKVSTAADGPIAWTAHADLAIADASLLLSDDAPDGPTPPLSGDEALDLAALAALVGTLAGAPVTREVLPDAAMVERMGARGAPAAAAEIALGFFLAARAGEFAAIDPTLGRLIGRAPTTMREVLTETLRRSTNGT
ncbi:NAD(P)H-binding protein [Rhodoferax sp.]|uniref:NAD(P)H-binding protein n=1 Tax=Rhodoferax sp. TaxID=50421 RepID=UPI00374CD944